MALFCRHRVNLDTSGCMKCAEEFYDREEIDEVIRSAIAHVTRNDEETTAEPSERPDPDMTP